MSSSKHNHNANACTIKEYADVESLESGQTDDWRIESHHVCVLNRTGKPHWYMDYTESQDGLKK